MATGITKREQFSEDAISALDFFSESSSPACKKSNVRLEYENKSKEEEILNIENDHHYINVCKNEINKNTNINNNSLILDDNLFVLHTFLKENRKVQLFYLDPPYETGMNFHSRDLQHAYNDNMGQASYIDFMRRRLILMRECLDDDGSIYVHIGHQMLAHMKIIMDEIFGNKNFRNIITRRKCSSKNFTSKQYANVNDFVLFYSKGKNYKWNRPGTKPDDEWIVKEYSKIDEIGRRYKLVPIHAPGARKGETGQSWKGMLPPSGKHWQYTPKKLEELDKLGDIHWSKNGNPRRKVYWTSEKKRSLTDYWDQFRDAHHQSVSITGYPTEKNLDMMKMIVGASSDPNDLVVDPFCGSGSALQAARDQNRYFLGIDASSVAAKATMQRMIYGPKIMGDYVNNRKESSKNNNFSILDTDRGDCNFYTDYRFYEKHKELIESIVRI